jgi:hypothetical protein
MEITLGTFACLCLEARFDGDLRSGTETALRHYAERLTSSPPPIPVPLSLPGRPPGDDAVTLRPRLAPELWEILELEALERAIILERLLAHAVFVYLADLDIEATVGAGVKEEAVSPR